MADIPNYLPGQDAKLYNERLNDALKDGISNNGFVAPSHGTSTILSLAAFMPNGTIWYDSETDELKVKAAGTVRVIQFV